MAQNERANTNEHFCTLRRFLKRKGYTYRSLALESGMSESTLSKIGSGRAWPNVYTALKLAKLLGVSVSDIWHID